jgi:acyl-CoA synthetase (AMP-forming)/AMP-acid ligase II
MSVFQVTECVSWQLTLVQERATRPLSSCKAKPMIIRELIEHSPQGETGEVVIRGANVTRGYENKFEGRCRGFHRRLVPHGDQGVMDEESFLRITGRLK